MNLRRLGRLFLSLFAFAFLLSSAPTAPARESWPSIPPEDLALKDNPASPGSPAMILYREEDTDQTNIHDFHETVYYRIKIFSDQGKKYADVEIPYFKNGEHIQDIHARTIHPDGKEIEFSGQVFDKTVVKFHDLNFREKAFTLPDVQPGSIIEYKFRIEWDYPVLALFLRNRWTLQEDLFMRRAVFEIRRNLRIGGIRWTGRTLHGEEVKDVGAAQRLEVVNSPAFEKEAFSPPENDLKPHLIYYYTEHPNETPDQFWQRIGREAHGETEKFIRKDSGVQQVVSQTVNSADPPEAKLRKLYARAQQIRNLSFEKTRTEEESKREQLKENKGVDDVLSRGFGSSADINFAFVAMARAAGFQALVVLVARRDHSFFSKEVLNAQQLDGTVVVVHLGNEDLYLDPGARFCPFGLLPWGNSETTGLRLEKDSGVLLKTWTPKITDAGTERKAILKLDADGTLQGKLEVLFTGLEALTRRLNERDEDDLGRRKDLQDELKKWFPAGASFELADTTGWENADEPLRAEGTFRLPNFASTAGRRVLLPVTIFRDELAEAFQHSDRTNPVYFEYPFTAHDDITVQLPDGLQLESLPASRETPPTSVVRFRFLAEQHGNTLHFERQLGIKNVFFPLNNYEPLRNFFSNVRASDEQQTVLHFVQAVQKN